VSAPEPSIVQIAQQLIEEEERLQGLPLSERAAWAIERERLLTRCLRAYARYHDGYVDGTKTTISLALKLLSAIEPLLLQRGEQRLWVEGTAPRLREAAKALKEHIGA
jgi:hypothetical protein